MKLKNIFRLQKLYYLFFIRHVLSVGILKEKMFRYFGLVLLIVVMIGMFLFDYNMFDGSRVLPEIDWVNFLIRTRLGEVVSWTIGVFILIKLLFLKKGSFLKMTAQLPITNHERNTSLLLFELLMILSTIGLLSFSYALAFMFRFELWDTLLLVSITFFTAFSVYLILQFSFVFITFLLEISNLAKFKSSMVYLWIAIVFFFIHQDITNFMLYSFAMEGFHWSLLFIWLNDEFHFIFSILAFLALSSLLIYLILFIPTHAYITEKVFVNFKLSFLKKTSLLTLYFLQILRRIENYVSVLVTYVVFIFLFTDIMTAGMINPFYAVMIITLFGTYMYNQTDEIRKITYKLNYNLLKDYVSMVFSQSFFIVFLSIPLIIIYLFGKSGSFPLASYLNVSLDLFIAILITTCAGILFPAKKENPFSPFIALIFTILVMGAIFYFSSLLNLSVFADFMVRLIFGGIIILVSCFGLMKLKELVRYEKH